MASRKLTFLTTGLSRGGAERQLTHLATCLAERSWVVQVVSMLEPSAYLDELDAAGVRVESLNMKRGAADLGSLVRTIRLLREWKPDILVTYMVHANLLGRIAGAAAGVPAVVSSIRNEWFGGELWERAMAVTDWMAAATVTNSANAARRFEDRGIVSAQKLRVIPNGIVLERFGHDPGHRAVVRHELGVGPDDFLWLAVGRLEPQKGFLSLLEAFEVSARGAASSRLAIAGAGSQGEILEERARVLGGRVQLLGLRTDVPRLLAAADGFVLSSEWEGLPNVVMEAMASRVPVVATRTGGVSELVEDRRSGLIVPPRDAQALAVGMGALQSMPSEERARMAESAFHRLEGEYALGSVVRLWENLFEELGARNRP